MLDFNSRNAQMRLYYFLLLPLLATPFKINAHNHPVTYEKMSNEPSYIMNPFKKLFTKKGHTTDRISEFWNWFSVNSESFFSVIKNNNDIEGQFINILGPKLEALEPGLMFLAGMADENTAELILTADGQVKLFPLIDDLVRSAPSIKGWKFTALKPASNIDDMVIEMSGLEFGRSMRFYPQLDEEMPDEIHIAILHSAYNESNSDLVGIGVNIFLDNYLGEYTFATSIDRISLAATAPPGVEAILIEKLQDYLTWRQKEFVEKYEGIRSSTEKDNYAALEARMPDGTPIVAIINSDVLKWDKKASHPWVLIVEIPYNGSRSNGMPDAKTVALLDSIEERMMLQLKDQNGYVNIGRETGNNARTIYFACREFELAARVMHSVRSEFSDKTLISYDIVRDKYWLSFNRFMR